MTHSIQIADVTAIAAEELPAPQGVITEAASLPRPVRAPKIVDTGRISFGAGFRLPTER